MDGKQAAIRVREHLEGISKICPIVFQTHSIKRIDGGYEVVCSVCSAMVGAVKYRGLVDLDGKLVRVARVDRHPDLTDANTVPDNITIGNLRQINTRQHKQICDLRATIGELEERDALKTTAINTLVADIRTKDRGISQRREMIDGLEAELSACKGDSGVLMRVVEIVKKDDRCPTIINQLANILVDYLDAPEGIPEGKTEVTQLDHETYRRTIRALRTDVADRDRHIDELKQTVHELRGEIQSMYFASSSQCLEQKTTIDELTQDLDARNKVIKDFKAIETKETNRLHETIEELRSRMAGAKVVIDSQAATTDEQNTALRNEVYRLRRINTVNDAEITELNRMFYDVGDKLARIEKIVNNAKRFDVVLDPVSIDKITKIIQEE